jgi:hypothetical protein
MSDSKTPDGTPGKGEKKEVEVRYVPVEYMDHGHQSEDEISLIDLIKLLWKDRKTIYICTALFFFLGLFIFLFGAREYESDAILIHEQQQGQSQLQILAQQFGGLGGGNQQGTEGVIPPSLYPRILESTDFLLAVISHEVEFAEPEMYMTPFIYFNSYYKPPLTERLTDFLFDYTVQLPITLYRGARNLIFGSTTEADLTLPEIDTRFLELTGPQRRALSLMRERITLEQNGSLLIFKVQMPDAKAAAELNEFVIEQIQEYVIAYRIKKYRQNLQFVEIQAEDAREQYNEAQLALAEFRDRNVNISTAVQRIQQQDLENRRNITFNIYNSLAQQREQARIRLQEETPVFNVLQKTRLPHVTARAPVIILFLALFAGILFGIFTVFGKNIWRVIRENINEV